MSTSVGRRGSSRRGLRVAVLSVVIGVAGLGPGCGSGDSTGDAADSGTDAPGVDFLPPGEISTRGMDDVGEESTDKAACREILIRYAGAIGAGDTITRSRDEARALADEIHGKIESGEATFEALLDEHSESLYRDRSCFVPPFPRGTRNEEFENAVFSIDIGEVTGVVETPAGFHILKRDVADNYICALILISHREAGKNDRTRFEAIQLIGDLHRRALAHPDSFQHLARKHTDGPRKGMGGNLGTFNRYTYGQEVGDIARSLEIGQVSQIFESNVGYNILKRLK